ncbi:MAG: VOC family protein [Gammaproteobacteria bacterium]|nr:VOC family protein [Gammaproteobacteria bacterium]
MKTAHPYLNFKGNTEQAFEFYKSVFGGEFAMLVRFGDFGEDAMGVAENDRNRIAHVSLPLGDAMLMGSDVVGSYGESFNAGNNFYVSLTADSAEEAERVFDALAAGGQVEMPLQQTEWAEKYGICVDRFGVRWMMGFQGDVQFG